MAKRGRPFTAGVKVSADDVRLAMGAARLWEHAQPHTRPGDLKRFIAEESARTGICRTKLFAMIRRITLQRATGVIWLDFERPKKRNKKTPNCTDSLTKR